MAYSSRSGVTHTGVPPFATNLPDSAYRSQQPTGRRPAQPPTQARPTSAYDHYTDMLDNDDSAEGIGAGFMNADATSDDESDDEEAIKRARSKQSMLAEAIQHERHAVSIPLASPRPGYAGKPAVLNPPTLASPPQQQQRVPPGLRAPPAARAPISQQRNGPFPGVDVDKKDPTRLDGGWVDTSRQISPAPPYVAPNMLSAPTGRPGTVSIAPSIPMTPQMTAGSVQPIKPAFFNNRDSVRFNEESSGFIRGGAEGQLIPRRGARGDVFWRRFSVIAKDKGTKERSSWLKITQSGTKSLSRGVWFISLILVICIAGGIGAGWYFGHNDSTHTAPKALGGSDDNGQMVPTSSTKSVKVKSTSSSLHVSPTNTVARRAAIPIPSSHTRRSTHLR